MRRYIPVLLLCFALFGCSNQGTPSVGSSRDADGTSSTAMDMSSRSTEERKAFDEHLAEAIERHGRFRVIELRVVDPPRGSGVHVLYDKVRLLRRSVDVPDGHGEIENGVGRFIIAPLVDIQFLAARIDFGSIVSIDHQQRVVTVRWDFD